MYDAQEAIDQVDIIVDALNRNGWPYAPTATARLLAEIAKSLAVIAESAQAPKSHVSNINRSAKPK